MQDEVGFGGGCHWCTEAVFQSLRGVSEVRQGFIASNPPDDGFSEAVLLHHDPDSLPLRILIAAHLATHASTSDHSMRGKYRSAIYTSSAVQADRVRDALAEISVETEMHFVTRVLPLVQFKPSDPRFHDYYRSDPERPFCRTYIDPKLAKLRRSFADYVDDGPSIIAR